MTAQNLLRPHQVAEMTEEKSRLERSLNNPHVQDKGEVARALRRISKQLETQTPTPYTGNETDRAVRREAELRDQILRGMPSQEEMRKSPPGAVGKHMEWEKRVKPLLAEWKSIRLRLNAGSQDPDVANFERYRPKTSTLNMDNAVVAGTQYFMPETTSPTVTFNDYELAALRELAPDLAAKLAMMTNGQRAEVKEALAPSAPPVSAPPVVSKAKNGMSPEKRAAASHRMKQIHAEKKAAKERAAQALADQPEHIEE